MNSIQLSYIIYLPSSFFFPFIHSSIHGPSIDPFIHSSIHSSIHGPSIDPFIHSSIHSSIHWSLHSSIHPSIHPSIHSPSIYSFIHPSIHPSIHPFIHSLVPPFIHSSIHSSIYKYIIYLYILFIGQVLRRGAHINDKDGLTDLSLIHYACKAGALGVSNGGSTANLVSSLIAKVIIINLASIHLPINPFIYPSIHPFGHPSIHSSIHPLSHLSMYSFIYPSTYSSNASIHPIIYLLSSIYMYLFIFDFRVLTLISNVIGQI